MFGFIVWVSVCASGKRLLNQLQCVKLVSYRYQNGVLQFPLMSPNGKTNLLSYHFKASKLEVQTFKKCPFEV